MRFFNMFFIFFLLTFTLDNVQGQSVEVRRALNFPSMVAGGETFQRIVQPQDSGAAHIVYQTRHYDRPPNVEPFGEEFYVYLEDQTLSVTELNISVSDEPNECYREWCFDIYIGAVITNHNPEENTAGSYSGNLQLMIE